MMQFAMPAEPLLNVDNLVVEYGLGNKTVHAVSGVSLQVARGENEQPLIGRVGSGGRPEIAGNTVCGAASSFGIAASSASV